MPPLDCQQVGALRGTRVAPPRAGERGGSEREERKAQAATLSGAPLLRELQRTKSLICCLCGLTISAKRKQSAAVLYVADAAVRPGPPERTPITCNSLSAVAIRGRGKWLGLLVCGIAAAATPTSLGLALRLCPPPSPDCKRVLPVARETMMMIS
jgi:hypothetical protein